MDTKQFLIESKRLIDTPEKWTQKYFATDGIVVVSVIHERAKCFCSLGAMMRVSADSRDYDTQYEARDVLSDVVGGSIPLFNDNHTHEEVMNAFDQAISNCEG